MRLWLKAQETTGGHSRVTSREITFGWSEGELIRDRSQGIIEGLTSERGLSIRGAGGLAQSL